jgi:hypothetical protein
MANQPRPLLTLQWGGGWKNRGFEEAIRNLVSGLAEEVAHKRLWPQLRCVSVEHLPNVLAYGCDVQPTDGVLWVDRSIDKTLEYGGEMKVMLVFRGERLMPTHREIPANTPPRELEALRRTYPTAIPSVDGQMLWLTRLPFEDRRATTPYETAYARWISGDPWEALLAVLVIGRDHERVSEQLRSVLQSCGQQQWHMDK